MLSLSSGLIILKTLSISQQRFQLFAAPLDLLGKYLDIRLTGVKVSRYPGTSLSNLGFLHFVVFAEIGGVGGVACHGGRSRNNCSPFYFQSSLTVN